MYNIKVLVVGPSLHYATPGSTRSSDENLRYSNAAKQVSEELGVAFVDLWDAFAKSNLDSSELLVDGIHFSGSGYKIYYNEILKTITKFYPNLDANAIDLQFPPVELFQSGDFEQIINEWNPKVPT